MTFYVHFCLSKYRVLFFNITHHKGELLREILRDVLRDVLSVLRDVLLDVLRDAVLTIRRGPCHARCHTSRTPTSRLSSRIAQL